MNARLALTAVVALCVASAVNLGCTRQHAQSAPPHRVLIGSYPESKANMFAMQAAADRTTIRAHAWAILAHFTHNGSNVDPDWEAGEGWEGKCPLGLGNKNCPKPSPQSAKRLLLEAPPQDFTLTHGGTVAKVQHPFQVSTVLYNHEAAGFIGQNGLAMQPTWDRLSHLSPAALNQKLTFPEKAVIVKEVWESVAVCNPQGQGVEGCPSTIRVWDPKLVPNIDVYPNEKYDAVANWGTSRLPIDTDLNRPCVPGQKYVYYNPDANPVPPAPPKSEWTPIRCFHYRSADPAVTTIWPNSGSIPGGAPIPGQKSYIVLVAFHLITAELPDWTWNTFYWTRPDIETGERNAAWEPIADHLPWSLYSMKATLSQNKPAEPKDGGPPVVYNPYLEGPMPNGPPSNCIACHSHAVYRKGKTGYTGNDFRNSLKPRCLILHPYSKCTKQTFLTDDQFFHGATPTHFLWSFAENLDPNSDENNIMRQNVTPQKR